MYVPDLGGIILLRKWKPGVERPSNPPCRERTNHSWVWIPQCAFSLLLSRLLCWFTSLGEGSGKTWHITADHMWNLEPGPLLSSSTAICLIIPKDICKYEKQICTAPCWRQRWDAYPICDDSLPLTDIPWESFRETKVQQETKISAQFQKGTWVLVFPPETTLTTHSITTALISKSWIMELSEIH